MEVLVKINPVTYAVAPIRAIGLDEELTNAGAAGSDSVIGVEVFGHVLSTLESLAILMAFCVLIFSVAIQSFRKRA